MTQTGSAERPPASKPDLDHFPTAPGVYLMKDEAGTVLYVGKALSLKKRVSSYFRPNHPEPKVRVLVRHIHTIDFIATTTEAEALILENNLIKKFQPRYNINLKDSKTYPYIKITNEPYPRIIKTRKRYQDNADYFGPYADVGLLYRNLDLLHKLFPIRTSKKKLPSYNPNEKPCLNYHIGKCLGCCINKVSQEDYETQFIEPARLFLRGQHQALKKQLTELMQAASASMEFEQAARLRDQLQTIDEIRRNQQRVEVPDPSSRDILGVFTTDERISLILMHIREGRLINKHDYLLNNSAPLSEVLADFLLQLPDELPELPDEIILPELPDEADGLEAFLRERRGKRIQLIVPQRGERVRLLKMASDNARLIFQREYKVSTGEVRLLELAKVLDLPKEPRRIEGWDIATTLGRQAVAAMVSFHEGLPDKRNYRIFKIRSKDTPDDYAMMEEGLSRRYAKLIAEDAVLPDLILIDGGKGQLGVAIRVLETLKLSIPVVSLAKREEEIYQPGLPKPLKLDRTHRGLQLLMYVRDEAHRYGNAFHRRLRTKAGIKSLLDGVPGIGERRKRALLKHFKSLEAIAAEDEDTLAALDGMNRAAAREVLHFLKAYFADDAEIQATASN